MKQSIQTSYFGVLILLLTLIVNGCASTQPYEGMAGNIIGTWKFKDSNYGPQTLAFRRDGVYELDTDGDGERDIWGSYRLSRDWLIMNDVGGDFVFDCGQQGAYTYRVKNDEVTFTLMADQCPSRNQAMSASWVKVSKPQAPPVRIKI